MGSPAKKQVGNKSLRKRSSVGQAPMAAAVVPLLNLLSPADHEARLAELCESMGQHGQRLPIIMSGKKIVDGRMRWEACRRLKIKPKFIDVGKLGGSQDPKDVWMQLNFYRRHLNDGERALLGLELAKGCKVGNNQHSGGASQQKIAVQLKTSPDSMRRAALLMEKAQEHSLDLGKIRARVSAGEGISKLLREVVQVAASKNVAKIQRKNGDALKSLEGMIASKARFSMIYADPPWDYGQSPDRSDCFGGDPALHYPVMSTDAIAALPIDQIADFNSLCWLWVPNCLLKDGLKVLDAWGFEYVTCMVWVKNRSPGSKGAVLPRHETVLVGKRNKGLVFNGKPASSVVIKDVDPQRIHSRKPVEFAEEIERLYGSAAKIELFCRQARPGWVVWGNEA
jgi:N6-adenosine-specific RNA methylase IME4